MKKDAAWSGSASDLILDALCFEVILLVVLILATGYVPGVG